MKLGIAGPGQSGKTTVFNILTGRHEEVGTFSTKAALAVVEVRDDRVDRIWEEYKPPGKVYPALTFHDSPPGIKETEALAALREMDLLLVVIRTFESESVPYQRAQPDPAADAAEMLAKLALSDMQLVEKRLERLEKMLRRPGPERDSHLIEQEALKRIMPLLEEGKSLGNFEMTADEEKLVRNYGLLTLKPVVYVLNAGEEQAGSPPSHNNAIVVFGKLEMEIAQLPEEDQETFLKEYGVSRSAPELLRRCYDALQVVTFYTTGDDEVRGWTVRSGTTAPEAAGKIHTDMEKSFIKAEVVSYEKLVEVGSLKEARASAGRLEGKNYIIQDGDIVTIRFNP